MINMCHIQGKTWSPKHLLNELDIDFFSLIKIYVGLRFSTWNL